MQLMTPELAKRFPGLYDTQNTPPELVKVVAKFFDPCSSWTWYAVEYDPEERVFFGLVKGFESELGYFSLDDFESIKGPLGLGIERDIHFGEHTLAEILKGGSDGS